MPCLRMALAQLQPRDYDLAVSKWGIGQLLTYLAARGVRALLDELDDAVDEFRKQIDRRS